MKLKLFLFAFVFLIGSAEQISAQKFLDKVLKGLENTNQVSFILNTAKKNMKKLDKCLSLLEVNTYLDAFTLAFHKVKSNFFLSPEV